MHLVKVFVRDQTDATTTRDLAMSVLFDIGLIYWKNIDNDKCNNSVTTCPSSSAAGEAPTLS